MATRFTPPITHLAKSDFSGAASGWKYNFYSTGTTTRKDTFSDNALTVANTNPVVADSAGRFGDIFLEAGAYRVILTDADDVTIWDADPVAGSIGMSGVVDKKAASYTVTIDDSTKVLAFDATSGNLTATLLAAATAGDGFEVTVKKTDSGANTVTVDGNGAETIDEAAAFVLSLQNQSVTVRSDGTNWLVVAFTRVATGDIDALAVTTAKIAANAVTEAKLDAAAAIQTNQIGGLKTSNGTDTTHDIDIAVGAARDGGDAVNIVLASALTKQIDAAWAVGTNAGGLDGTESVGGTPDASTMYYIWLIRRSDTGVVDALFSESATGPTMPTNYDQKRLIGVVKTDGSANIIQYTQSGDYFRYTGDIILDIYDAGMVPDTFKTGTLSVPPSCLAHVYGYVSGTTGEFECALYLKTKGAADVAATAVEAFIVGDRPGTTAVAGIGASGTVLVNASSQVEYAVTERAGAETVKISTIGFTMLTRRDP